MISLVALDSAMASARTIDNVQSAIYLMAEEFRSLKSQIATSKRANVGQAPCLCGTLAFRSDSAAGWKPASPTAETVVPFFSNPRFAIRNPRL